MSFVKVINGPVARAGSIFNLLSNRGNAVPNKDANMITINKEVVTVIGMASDVKLKQSDKIKMIEEQMQAFMTAHEISFEMLWNIFFDVRGKSFHHDSRRLDAHVSPHGGDNRNEHGRCRK